jgi:hypothetical protein
MVDLRESVAFDAAIGEADDARGVLEEALIVRGEDEGEAEGLIKVAHEIDELGCVARVQIGGGLVGEDYGWAMDDGASDGNALTFAA